MTTVLFKTPADFISDVIGGSETKTKKILDNALGKVLVIDEAYALSNTGDPFKTAVIDTIVSEVQNVPGDDRCVLLLGYKEQMEDMMQKVNPGLARRFPIDSGFLFEDFTDAEMAVIFDAKLKAQAFIATPKGRIVALEMLGRMRNRPNFGNAGAVDILLNDAKMRQQKRFARDSVPRTAILEAEDFDPDYERSERAITNIEMLFKGVVGCDKIVDQMKGYQNIATNMRERGMDPRAELPFTFLFRGPPGKSFNSRTTCGLSNNDCRYWKNDDRSQDGQSVLRHGLPRHSRSGRVLRERHGRLVRRPHWPEDPKAHRECARQSPLHR
jgi:hypothetical protein